MSCASEPVTLANNFEMRKDQFTVCLLAKDKDEDSLCKLVEVNVATGEERTITEIPYRNNCAMIYVTGMLDGACSVLDIQ